MSEESALCVILAEDNDDIRALFAAAFARDGYVVIQVTSGIGLTAHLRTLRRDRTDAIVTDLRMPGMSGLRAVALLHESGWHLPVVVVTAFADDWAREEAAILGVDALVEKPCNPIQLSRLVTQLLAKANGRPRRFPRSGGPRSSRATPRK